MIDFAGDVVFTKAELDYHHPLNSYIMSLAAPRIAENLTRLTESYYDMQTYLMDSRRTNVPLHKTIFRVDYKKDSVTITNELATGGFAPQFRYLHEGNGSSKICAQGYTRHVLKGRDPADRHKTDIIRGVRMPVPKKGDLGVLRPKVLKFWGKKTGTWVYRKCVRPIDSNITNSFRTSVRVAVKEGLESAYRDADYETEMDLYEETMSENIAQYVPIEEEETDLMEDLFSEVSQKTLEDEKKEIEEAQTTAASREGRSVADHLRSFGNKANDVKNYLETKATGFLGGLWRRKQ